MPVSQSDTGEGRLIPVLDWHQHFLFLYGIDWMEGSPVFEKIVTREKIHKKIF
jgi:hypothetical protein